MDNNENYDQHSIALEPYNGSSAFIDISHHSDVESTTIPSLSFDENLLQLKQSKEYFLKELHDKIENLRQENFDLKMKLYLLENDNKYFENNSELKQKILKEFDRKNDEIRCLKRTIADKNNEIDNLKISIQKSKINQNDIDKYKAKLIELYGEYSKLMNKQHYSIDSNMVIENMNEFFTNNNIKMNEINNKSDKHHHHYSQREKHHISVNQSTQTDKQENDNIKIESNTKTNDNFQLKNLQLLINDFRNNQINYKTFLQRLDQISSSVNDVQQQQQQQQQSSQEHYHSNNNEFKQKIYKLLAKQLKDLDEMNRKISIQMYN